MSGEEFAPALSDGVEEYAESRVEDVLAEHRFSAQAYYQRTDQWTARCLADDCDWTARGDTGGRDTAEAAHRAHVAAEVGCPNGEGDR